MRNARKVERSKRYAEVRTAEADLITVYSFTQDNYGKEERTLKSDISNSELSGMTSDAESDKEARIEEMALEFPHLMNPYQRESIRILQDLISITKSGDPLNLSKVNPVLVPTP